MDLDAGHLWPQFEQATVGGDGFAGLTRSPQEHGQIPLSVGVVWLDLYGLPVVPLRLVPRVLSPEQIAALEQRLHVIRL